jgi:NDP-sugar pyrophosphorylase family protein
MKALILAAGRGTRLGELTKNQPKPTIKIGNKTILRRIIENLHRHKIFEIIINCHYLPLMIVEDVGADALYFYEEQLLGHDGTINYLRQWLEGDDFLVINGDTISNINFTDMIRQHEKGTISVLFDAWRAAGTWLYPKEYFENPNVPIKAYRPSDLVWFDVGTPDRFEKAKEYFE